MFRSQVEIFPVLTNVGEGVATDHGRVMPLVVGKREESVLEVVSSPGDVGPGRVLTTVLGVTEVGYSI